MKNKQVGLLQTKKLLHSKGNYQQKLKGNLPDGRNYLQIIYLIRIKIYKEQIQLNSKK